MLVNVCILFVLSSVTEVTVITTSLAGVAPPILVPIIIISSLTAYPTPPFATATVYTTPFLLILNVAATASSSNESPEPATNIISNSSFTVKPLPFPDIFTSAILPPTAVIAVTSAVTPLVFPLIANGTLRLALIKPLICIATLDTTESSVTLVDKVSTQSIIDELDRLLNVCVVSPYSSPTYALLANKL